MSNQRQQRGLVSARTGAKKHSEGDRSAIKIPPGMGLYKVEKIGTILLDFAPYVVGKGNKSADEGQFYFERTYWAHFGVGPNSKTFICPAKTAGKACPICEEVNKIYQRTDIAKKAKGELTSSIRSKQRQLFIVKDAKIKDDPWKLWDFSYHNFGELLDSLMKDMDEDADFDLFAHPEKGYTLTISIIEATTGNNPYKKAGGISFTKRKPLGVSLEDLAESQPCLDDLLIMPTYEQLKKAFYGDEDEDEENPQNVSTQQRISSKATESRSSGNGASKSRSEPDEDEDELEDEPVSRQRVSANTKAKGVEENQEGAGSELPEWCRVEELCFYKGEECRILRISKDGKSLVLEGEDGDEYRGISPKDCKPYEVGAQDKVDKDEEPTPRRRK
jgi:phage FluMu protein Com